MKGHRNGRRLIGLSPLDVVASLDELKDSIASHSPMAYLEKRVRFFAANPPINLLDPNSEREGCRGERNRSNNS